jgi:hypothetical protein
MQDGILARKWDITIRDRRRGKVRTPNGAQYGEKSSVFMEIVESSELALQRIFLLTEWEMQSESCSILTGLETKVFNSAYLTTS